MPSSCFQFLSPKVEWLLSAADPQTLGEELPSNAIKFSGTEGFRQLAFYFCDRLHVISGDLTGCIPRHHYQRQIRRSKLPKCFPSACVSYTLSCLNCTPEGLGGLKYSGSPNEMSSHSSRIQLRITGGIDGTELES